MRSVHAHSIYVCLRVLRALRVRVTSLEIYGYDSSCEDVESFGGLGMALALLDRGISTYKWSKQLLFLSFLVLNPSLVLTQEVICSPTPRTIQQSFLQQCSVSLNENICNQKWNLFKGAVIGRPYNSILPR